MRPLGAERDHGGGLRGIEIALFQTHKGFPAAARSGTTIRIHVADGGIRILNVQASFGVKRGACLGLRFHRSTSHHARCLAGLVYGFVFW